MYSAGADSLYSTSGSTTERDNESGASEPVLAQAQQQPQFCHVMCPIFFWE